jgi:uncharacterized protein (TIGR02145 family)
MRILIIVAWTTLLLSCGNSSKKEIDKTTKDQTQQLVQFTEGTYTDSRDGKSYRTIKFTNGQTWLNENLAYYKDSLIEKLDYHSTITNKDVYKKIAYMNIRCSVKDCKDHMELDIPYSSKEHQEMGYFYDFQSAKVACPSGWHLPAKEEWRNLANYLNPDLKNIQNNMGFIGTIRPVNGLKLNFFSWKNDDYSTENQSGIYWTSTPIEKSYDAFAMSVNSNYQVNEVGSSIGEYNLCRCVTNAEVQSNTPSDNEIPVDRGSEVLFICSVVGKNVNIRKENNTNSEVLFQLNEGDKLNVLDMDGSEITLNGKTGKWYYIEYEGKEGCVFSTYTKCE